MELKNKFWFNYFFGIQAVFSPTVSIFDEITGDLLLSSSFGGFTKEHFSPPNPALDNNIRHRVKHYKESEEILLDVKKASGKKQWYCPLHHAPTFLLIFCIFGCLCWTQGVTPEVY